MTYYRETDYCRFYNLSLLAIYLRRFLFCQTSYRNKPELIQGLNPENPLSLSVPNYRFETMIKAGIASLPVASRSEHRMVDYACPARKNPLFAERVLLAACFRNYSKWSPSRQSVFLLYLVVRRYIAGFFVQNNMRYGFQNFKRYERLSDILIPKDSRVRNVLYEWTKQYLCEDSGLRKLEVRVAPKNTFTETVARIQAIQKTMHRDLPFHTGLVLHFIKNSRPINTRVLNRWSLPPRGYEDLSSYENQIGFVKRFAKSRWAGIHLVGIDAANEEIRCRPETFAPFFRAIRDGAHKKFFGLTFHVGEDFVTLMDGLRAIEEALIYLPLSAGDRLGHASALGTDIESYFTLKGKNIITTKQDALDDLSYLLRFVQKENRFAGFCSGVEKELNKLGKDIFGSVFSLEHYLNSQQLRTDHPLVHLGTKHYDNYSRAQAFWRIRGQGYYLGEIENKDYQRAWSDSIARELVRLYHESPSARAKGDELYHFEATKEYKSALSFVQEAIQTQLIERQIGIETNPTSNYLIGPYSDFSEIPFMRFSKINGLKITVGTDDPGLFYTNLQSEYAALFCYFSQETRESKRSIEKRFNKLAKDSLEMSFVSEYTSK